MKSSNIAFKLYLKIKEKIIPLSISLLLVFLFSFISILSPKPVEKGLNLLENLSYDVQVRNNHRPIGKDSSIAIIDIDDKSLEKKGRWPWPRKILAELVAKLYKAGATIIALDLTFPEAEDNILLDVVDEIKKQPEDHSKAIAELTGLQKAFDYDEQFAKSLALGDSVLGFVLSDQGATTGELPSPYLTLTPELENQLAIPNKNDYLGNIAVLQKAAKNGGFLNTTKDEDGVLRFTNLLLRRGADVYASLSMKAVSLYLLAKDIRLITQKYGDSTVLEGIQLDQLVIQTDPEGQILIPYRGPAFSFPYISAADFLDGKVDASAIEGKLIFIGISASALSDLYSTSVDTVFPGVEIHATIAAGIIDQYLPYKPFWGRGIISALIIVTGLACAMLFPFLGALMSSLLAGGFTALIMMLDNWLWSHQGIVIATLLPLILIWTLFILNLIWGYFSEAKRGKELKSVFGQYVPPAYLEEMMQKGGEINLEGESKELSVLFSDIRNFTNLSEKMTASELKQFLNRFFNPITEVIFNNRGTIDKYVGDMVMAFWGAPLEDPKHSYQAVYTALEMQEKLAELNKSFQQEGKPQIKIGIGVNTGMMNVGDMGSKFRRSYTVLGDTVNLASRLEGQSKYYHVDNIVGELTWQQTKDEIVYRKIDKIKVKGKDKGVEIFQPVCKVQNLTEAIKEELELHHRALDAYFRQEWETAASLFQQSKGKYPANAELYQVYLDRIEKLRIKPYVPGWDGAYVSHEK